MHVSGVLELRLVARGLVLGMRCTSVSLRNKWTALVGKLLRRISSSIHFILHKWSTGPGSAGALGTAEQAEKDRDIACESPVMPLSDSVHVDLTACSIAGPRHSMRVHVCLWMLILDLEIVQYMCGLAHMWTP